MFRNGFSTILEPYGSFAGFRICSHEGFTTLRLASMHRERLNADPYSHARLQKEHSCDNLCSEDLMLTSPFTAVLRRSLYSICGLACIRDNNSPLNKLKNYSVRGSSLGNFIAPCKPTYWSAVTDSPLTHNMDAISHSAYPCLTTGTSLTIQRRKNPLARVVGRTSISTNDWILRVSRHADVVIVVKLCSVKFSRRQSKLT
jgi:hypothetical protein